MYLSYSPLSAPSAAASTRKNIHLLCLKSMPSFLPLRLSRKNDTADSPTPIHWYILRCSPNTTTAPTSTITGRVALIGPTMVMGRCFMAMYPNDHELSTITLLSTMYLCTSHPYCPT